MAAAQQIEAEAMRLAPAKRIKLAEKLLESVDSFTPNVAGAWDEEIRQRLDEIRSGKAEEIPASDVMQQARKVVRETRRLSPSRRKGAH